MREKSETVHLTLPSSMRAAMRELASEKFISESAVMRNALDFFFREIGRWPEERA